MPFSLRNLKHDLKDVVSISTVHRSWNSAWPPDALGLEQSGLCYQRIPPGYRFPYGHTHKTQEEVYVVVRGSGRMKLDDEIVELREWDAGACPTRYVARLRSRARRPRDHRDRSAQSRRRSAK